MKRQAIKTTANTELEFIPSAYEGMDRNAADPYDKPLVIVGKRLKREQRYEVDSKTHVKYNKDPKDIDFQNLQPGDIEILGKGETTKFIWDCCFVKALNVITADEEGNETVHEEYTDGESLWNAIGLDLDIAETTKFWIEQSKLNEAEAKN